MLPGRVCDPSEAVADPLIKFPIPETLVLVEFFNLPMRLGRFYLLEPKQILPFNEGEDEGWSTKLEAKLLEVWKRKYDVATANRVYRASMDTAREFLRLAQSKIEIQGTDDDAVVISGAVGSQESIDVEQFRLRKSGSEGECFEAGDWVEYEHIVLKCTMQSRVIEVTGNPSAPLVLENGDALDIHQLVVRIPATEAVKSDCGRVLVRSEFQCSLLGDFNFREGRLEGVEGLHESLRREGARCRSRFERETGMLLQHKKRRVVETDETFSSPARILASPASSQPTANKSTKSSADSGRKRTRVYEVELSPEDELRESSTPIRRKRR